MLTYQGLLWANGMAMSWVDGGGIEYWFGAWVSRGYQVLSKSRQFPRSAIGLAIVLHLAGPFAPTKGSFSDMRTNNVPFQLI